MLLSSYQGYSKHSFLGVPTMVGFTVYRCRVEGLAFGILGLGLSLGIRHRAWVLFPKLVKTSISLQP